jgi:hypothetical protein
MRELRRRAPRELAVDWSNLVLRPRLRITETWAADNGCWPFLAHEIDFRRASATYRLDEGRGTPSMPGSPAYIVVAFDGPARPAFVIGFRSTRTDARHMAADDHTRRSLEDGTGISERLLVYRLDRLDSTSTLP